MSTSQSEPVLELRIHGVNNTPPHEMLDLPPGDVELAFGDDLGSFWHPTPDAVDRGRIDRVHGETSRGVVDPDEPPRGRVPHGIHRETYSWGGMVRTAPPESGLGGIVLAVLARAAWTLLLPFSIANAAIWAWQLPSPAAGRRIRLGAAVVRTACLTLTLVLALSLASVAIDLFALQCFRGGQTVCAPLGDAGATFAAWKDERRVALFSLLPVFALVAVFLVARLSILRYNVAGRILGGAVTDDGERPLLAEPRFWLTRTETDRLATLHLAAGIATVALVTSFAFASDTTGVTPFLAGASILVVVVCAALVATTDSTPYELTRADRRIPGALLAAASVLYAAPAVVLGFHGDIRLEPRIMGQASDRILLVVVAAALLLIVVAWALPARERERRAWRGRGAAVFLTLGLAIELLLGSLLNVLAGDWLNGPAAANRLDQPYPDCSGEDCLPGEMTIGPFFAPFLGLTLLAIVVAAVVVGAMMIRPRDVGARAPHAASATDDASARAALTELLGREIAQKRALAARLHLAEPMVGALAVAFFAATVLAVALAAFPGLLGAVLPSGTAAAVATAFARWIDASLIVWVVIGLAVTAGLVLGGRRSSRPLALVWDLACFLPRAGHPFGAPCYAERAVPEVARRVRWWLDLPPVDHDGTPEPRSVILAAHSMGAVVAVAALYALRNDPAWASYRDRIALLTFGVQLRPFFGRFFPEVLGPGVIGAVPCGRPSPWARDPWARADLGSTASEVPGGFPASAWLSLWRLTDYLGFPARSVGSAGNDRDRYTEEIDLSGYVGVVDTHRWYSRTPAYHRALDELRQRLRAASGR
ncbi:hypothetical protein [Agromyces sp. C10]|uniref:hypothetical protein n=1 Tax=Agromyces sp. C10 TaxID=2935077 RepID=UPI00200A73F6|nr:hypothetical protein [Agromyces sp. C10]MCK8609837.1 hypothetical protein [Agromyces sp. C10]